MNTTTRHLEFKDEKSSKFWDITQAVDSVTVRYGKTGTTGQSQTKAFADAAEASKHAQKLIAEKLGKGYVEQGITTVPSAETVNDSVVEQPTTPKPKKTEAKANPVKPIKPKRPIQDPEASPESLTALLGKDDATNRLLAKHPRASAELLEKLSHSSDKATRQAVTGNPNTPPESFVRLGQQFPKEFLANPALDLLLMVNPSLLDEVPESLLIRLLKQTDCPVSLLTWASGHPQAKVQLAVAMNAKAPEQALGKLHASKHAVVLEAVQAQTSTDLEEEPESAFEQAVKDRLASLTPKELQNAWDSKDIGLAQWPLFTVRMRLEVLLGSEVWSELGLLATQFLPKSIWEELLNSVERYERTFVFDLVNSPSAVPEKAIPLLERFASDEDPAVRRAVARNPALMSDTVKRLLEDSHTAESAALNPRVPADDLCSLARSESEEIRLAVARNPSTPTEALKILLDDVSPYVREAACAHGAAPHEQAISQIAKLAELAKNEEWIKTANDFGLLATCVVANPRATEAQIRNILKWADKDDLSWEVYLDPDELLCAAGTNSSASTEFLHFLWKRKKCPSELIAKNPNVAAENLSEFICGKDNRTRISALTNPSLPAEQRTIMFDRLIGTHLSLDNNPWVFDIVSHTSAAELKACKSGQIFYFCGNDPNKSVLSKRPVGVLMALCSGPHIEASRVAKVAGSTDWLIRAAVARNLGTPPNLLKKLRSDAHPLVAALASKSLESDKTSKPQGNVESATSDSIDLVRVEVEILRRMRSERFEWTCTPIINSSAWSDRADLNDVLNWLKRFDDFDELVARFLFELEVSQRDSFWEWVASAKDDELRIRLVQHSAVPKHALIRFSSDESLGVLFALAVNPELPNDLQSKVVKAAVRAIKKGGKSFRKDYAAIAPLAVREHLVPTNDSWINDGLNGCAPQYPEWMTLDPRSPRNEAAKAIFDEARLASEDAVEQGFLDKLRSQCAEKRLSQLRHAFKKEILKSEPSVPDLPKPLTTSAVLSAVTWLDCVPISDRVAPSKSARSTDWLTRLAAAIHPSATDAILKLLSGDADPDVAAAARIRLYDNKRCAA